MQWDTEEFFDMVQDPFEERNVIESTPNEKLEEARRRMKELWVEAAGNFDCGDGSERTCWHGATT